jgi:pyruvate kinase
VTTQDIDRDGGRKDASLHDVQCELAALRAAILAETARAQRRIDAAHPDHRNSARNLLHYLALRRRDLRPLQQRLAALGLSSLGRAEAHVLATIDAVSAVLLRLMGSAPLPLAGAAQLDFSAGKQLLARHTEQLLGPARPERNVHIMVTMPAAAADDYALVRDLLAGGMDCVRINCAHDDAATWERIIDNVRRASRELGRGCKIAMDLAGPKLRTGPLESGPQVVRVRPQRDVLGRVVAPARIWLTPEGAPRPAPAPADASLALNALWLARLQAGDDVKLVDARDAQRTLAVVDAGSDGCWLEADKTAYLVPGTVLRHRRRGHKGKGKATRIAALPALEDTIVLHRGDQVVLTRSLAPGRPAVLDSAGQLLAPARIGCTLPQVFDDVRPGEAIWFDDGKIGGVIERVEAEQLHVRITQARERGDKLRADKGINLPDSALSLAAMTPKDSADLAFIARHADIVELSFANRAADVTRLQEELARLGERQPAIVLKIETRCGFDNLPEMLLAAMRSPCCGVMIARGDLAVESGFERLAEVQEEMLWICEAAHVPVIWATQVLETLARDGRPSRAEITDAAMGDRAECAMLNKGPYIVDAVKTLDDILKRMQAHQDKKYPMLRMLGLAHGLAEDPVP